MSAQRESPKAASTRKGSVGRLVGRDAFTRHRKDGAKRFEGVYFSAYVNHSATEREFSVVAPKRLGGAVERNRAKRRLREAFLAGASPKSRVVCYAKEPVLKAEFRDLVVEFAKITAPCATS